MALPHTLANGPGNLPDASQLMDNFNALVLKGGDTMTGSLAFNPTTAGITGTTTNDNAASGNVGQYVSSAVASSAAPASGNYGDLTSISLTAGDWDVSALCSINLGAATVLNADDFDTGISLNSGNTGTGLNLGDNLSWNAVSSATGTVPITTVSNSIPNFRISTSSTISVYLKNRVGGYGGATPTLSGRISARRIR